MSSLLLWPIDEGDFIVPGWTGGKEIYCSE